MKPPSTSIPLGFEMLVKKLALTMKSFSTLASLPSIEARPIASARKVSGSDGAIVVQ